jgi:hypothetical protein
MTEADFIYKRLRQITIDGLMVLGFVLLVAVELPL